MQEQILVKPKLLIITNRLVIGGPTKDILSICMQLKNDFHIRLLSGLPKATDKVFPISNEIANAIDIQYCKNLNSSFNFIDTLKAYFEIKKQINQFKPTIVHTHCAKPGLLGRIAAKRLSVNKIFHTFHGHFFHSYFNKLISYLIIHIEKYLARKSTKIVCLSNSQAFDLVNKYKIAPAEKVTIIPLGIDLNSLQNGKEIKRKKFREKFKLQNNEVAVGIVGRTSPVKNHSLFLQIAKAMNNQPQFKFFIVGDGDETIILQQALIKEGLKFSTNENFNPNVLIFFTSWYLNIEEVHLGLDFELITSLNEGTPLSIIEAMASGTPVIATNVGGINDLIIHEETGLLVNTFEVDSFVNYLQLLATNLSLKNKIVANAIHFANEKFSIKIEVDLLKKLYN